MVGRKSRRAQRFRFLPWARRDFRPTMTGFDYHGVLYCGRWLPIHTDAIESVSRSKYE